MISGFFYQGRAHRLSGLPASPPADINEYRTYMNGYNSVKYTPFKTPGILKDRKTLVRDLSAHIGELLKESVRGPADSVTDVDRAILLDLNSLTKIDSEKSEAYRKFYNTLHEFRARKGELSRAKQINLADKLDPNKT